MATSGGKQAIFNAMVSLINPGDEVLMAKPYWVTFPEIVVFAGGTPVFIETEETGFLLTADQVERAITPRTKLIILNSPCNPSGRVIPPAEFQRIMELLARARNFRHLGRMLSAICLSTRRGLQRRQSALRTSQPALYRRFIFQRPMR